MDIPIIIVLISFVVQNNAQLFTDGRPVAIMQTNPEFDGQLIGSGGDFGADGFLPALGLPLLGSLLLLGLTGGGTRAVAATTPIPSTPCPPCPILPTTACPTPAVCNPTPDCPLGFVKIAGILTKCYRVTASSNYFEAKATCHNLGGNLAEFANAAEQANVQAFVNGLTGGPFYVGYNDCNGQINLVGDDSRTTPNPVFIGGANNQLDCGRLNAGANPTAVDCTTVGPGICEARIGVVPCVCT